MLAAPSSVKSRAAVARPDKLITQLLLYLPFKFVERNELILLPLLQPVSQLIHFFAQHWWRFITFSQCCKQAARVELYQLPNYFR